MPLYNVITAHAICLFCQVRLDGRELLFIVAKTRIVCVACLWEAYRGIYNLLWACTCDRD